MTAAATRTLALALSTLALAGCAGDYATPTQVDCTPEARPICSPLQEGCPRPAAPCGYLPPGATNALVEIGSSPTPANIYVDGEYVGKTPLKRYLWFSSTTRAVTVVAEPLYPGQARQEQRLRVPPLPGRLTFFMNNAPTGEDGETQAR
jgi:hypothetical protein